MPPPQAPPTALQEAEEEIPSGAQTPIKQASPPQHVPPAEHTSPIVRQRGAEEEKEEEAGPGVALARRLLGTRCVLLDIV